MKYPSEHLGARPNLAEVAISILVGGAWIAAILYAVLKDVQP